MTPLIDPPVNPELALLESARRLTLDLAAMIDRHYVPSVDMITLAAFHLRFSCLKLFNAAEEIEKAAAELSRMKGGPAPEDATVPAVGTRHAVSSDAVSSDGPSANR